MSSIISTVALLGSLAASVSAHGFVSGYVAGTEYYPGYDITFTYQTSPPVVVGWSHWNQDNGYVSDYTSEDIICHKSSTNAGAHATINGGEKLEFQWNTWPESHKGPVITYLAKCDAKCEDADKTTLKWFKIDEAAQVDKSSYPGTWATDNMIANNNSYSVTIPSSIASGNYVARHEIIALHSAENSGGAQNYPYCVNLAVTSSGTDNPEGELATALYTATDPGILVNIYAALDYVIPGPALYKGASSGSSSTAASSAAASTAATSTAAATSSAAATYSAAATSSAASVTAQAAAVTTSSAAVSAAATSDVTDVVYATTAVTVTGSAPAATSVAASATASASASPSSSAPSKSIPEGTTLQDLLNWVTELFDAKTTSSKAKRSHPRHIRI